MLETRHAVRRLTALSGNQLATRSHPGAGAVIRVAPAQARFSLRLDAADAKVLGAAAGFQLDVPLNTRSVTGDLTCARLGPNEWLLTGPDSDCDVIVGQIDAALAGRFYALVDIGHRNVAIEVSGRHAPEVLNSGCPLDLTAAAFPTGTATRTLLGKAEIVLMRIDDAPTFRIECWRSFAGYVSTFLAEAAREFEPVVG
jgi:sarcosine oxidase subunit gamma